MLNLNEVIKSGWLYSCETNYCQYLFEKVQETHCIYLSTSKLVLTGQYVRRCVRLCLTLNFLWSWLTTCEIRIDKNINEPFIAKHLHSIVFLIHSIQNVVAEKSLNYIYYTRHFSKNFDIALNFGSYLHLTYFWFFFSNLPEVSKIYINDK